MEFFYLKIRFCAPHEFDMPLQRILREW